MMVSSMEATLSLIETLSLVVLASILLDGVFQAANILQGKRMLR